ncbi:MAG: hypothetical protein A2075_12130 [Geobacteraceae bacterium GWC2_58_44]|nr:MAG: hypothetical protein A2075_12130 [Geobacteraceae bacterium GWC2_58_44]HBG06310.1 hypothetical protein [Geobacter sp.]
MRRFAVIAALAGLLCACSHHPDIVQVPLAVPCPEPPAIARPHLPAVDLNAYTPPDQVMKALVASLEILKGYAGELETLLNGYRPRTGDR